MKFIRDFVNMKGLAACIDIVSTIVGRSEAILLRQLKDRKNNENLSTISESFSNVSNDSLTITPKRNFHPGNFERNTSVSTPNYSGKKMFKTKEIVKEFNGMYLVLIEIQRRRL